MNDPTLAFIFLFWHAVQKEIRNVGTLISVVHTFLTSLNLFTQPFLRGETGGGNENASAERNREGVTEKETERKEDLGLREQRENGIWELRKERKRGIGDRG